MRIVPRSPGLRFASPRCSTNPGSSMGPVNDVHWAALPSLPAIAFRPPESDERSREFHLWILPPQADGLLDPGISVKPTRWIGFAFGDPLLVGLGKIADIKPRQRLRVAGYIGIGRTRVKSGQQLFGHVWLLASVERGSSKGLHSY